jgi:hypothetical protein
MKKILTSYVALLVIALVGIAAFMVASGQLNLQEFGMVAAAAFAAIVAFLKAMAGKAIKPPVVTITLAEKAGAEKVNQDAQDKSSAAILATPAADLVSDAGAADPALGAKRDTDIDASADGYRQGVLDRSSAEVSGIFSGAGDRQDPPGRGG